MSRPCRTALLAVTALLFTAGAAAAQACLGIPSRDGQIALAGAYTRMNDFDAVGGEFHVDVSGPASFGFAYSRDFARASTGDADDVNSFEARLAYELFLVDPSVCAVAGVRYLDAPVERLGVPVGFGFGKTLRGDRLSATLYGLPQYVWLRQDLIGTDDVETSNEFMAEAGVTLGFLPFFVGGAVVVSTMDDDDARFRLRAGFLF